MLIGSSFYIHLFYCVKLIFKELYEFQKISQFFKAINILRNRIGRVAIFSSRESAQSDEKKLWCRFVNFDV